jgi:cell fate regulator YaaT (PSP1 superfamily)
MPELIEVRFKGNRKEFYTWEGETPLTLGSTVVVEAERGEDVGTVSAVGEAATKKCGVGCSGCALTAPKEARGKALRTASPDETRASGDLRRAEEDVRRKVIEKTRAHNLDMKISDAEWQWDRKKLTIYFTAEQRVDFRNLVRELASLFHTRIDLRQIGARDEAKRLDGVGRCGRQYCCSSWLPELRPVSLSLAKDQHLSLNPAQISGGCGRLLCCLRYEHDFYVSSRKRFPKEGKTVETRAGTEMVQAVDIFRERVLLRGADGTSRTLTLAEFRDESTPGDPNRPRSAPIVASAPVAATAPAAPAPREPRPPRPPRTPRQPAAPQPPAAATPASPDASADEGAKRRKRRRRRGRGQRPDGQGPPQGGPDNPPPAPPTGEPGGA